MTCQCYQIGGPFIAEDPDCAEHGTESWRLRGMPQDKLNRIEKILDEYGMLLVNRPCVTRKRMYPDPFQDARICTVHNNAGECRMAMIMSIIKEES